MKELAKKLKQVLEKNKEIIDIILFGSIVKGKIKPSDIDIAVLSISPIERIFIKKQIEKTLSKKIDIQILTLNDYNKFIWITLLREGFSVKHNKYLFEIYKMQPLVLYKYSLKELSLSKKVMFERALKNFSGIEKISNRVILVPIQKSEEFSEFLRQWGIDFDAREYALLPLVRKEEI